MFSRANFRILSTAKPASDDVLAYAKQTLVLFAALAALACSKTEPVNEKVLKWYVFNERSGAFEEAARRCSLHADYSISLEMLPADADQQHEQLARRLAAGDQAIDIIGMDVIWTAEFAHAGWIQAWPEKYRKNIIDGRLQAALNTAFLNGKFWALPFTTNTQLLWYRTDLIKAVPRTWDDLITTAEQLDVNYKIEVQGERYEGLTVFFISLLASAGGRILDSNQHLTMAESPTRAALRIMSRLARSKTAPNALASAREDQSRLAFETGGSVFMINYPYVWPSALHNAPTIAKNMAWTSWPRVRDDLPSRVTIGGINLAVSAFSRHKKQAFEAAKCLAGIENQRLAAEQGGLPPTIETLYDDSSVRQRFPFADLLRSTLKTAVSRPHSPVYTDISLAINRILHPMRNIDPERDSKRLRKIIDRALRSQGLL